MPNRTAKFVSAIFAGLLAGNLVTTVSPGAAGAAEDCLSGPKGEAPKGNHWYYRVDRVTKRHCWYVREEREKLSQTAPSPASSSARPIAAKTEPTLQRSVADARAELPLQTRTEPPDRGNTPALANAAAAQTIIRSPDAATLPSVVASRWPDPSGGSPTTESAPARRNSVAAVNAAPPPQPPAVRAAGQFAPADPSPQTPKYSVQMHLAALMAAVALAGMLGSIIFKFAFARRPAGPNLRARPDPGAIWEPTDDDRIVLPAHPETDAPARPPGFARGVDRSRNTDDRIAEFFSQLSRRAPT